MDEQGLDPAIREEALRGIEAISHWWGQRAPLLRGLNKLIGAPGPRALRLIEVGAGSGHLSRYVEAGLRKLGHQAEVLATDLHPLPGVQALDCLDLKLPEADIYFSSLTLHHLGDWDLVRMLRAQAAASRIGFLHFDLQRSRLHFQLAALQLAARGFHRINRVDALLSINQGYKRAELQGLAKAAGLPCQIRWSAPFRWLLSWKR